MGLDVNPDRVMTVSAFDAKTEEEKTINFKVVKIAGYGTSIVYKVKLVDTGDSAAIKTVGQLKSSRSNERELKLLKMTSHPNIVDFRFYFIEDSQWDKIQQFLHLGFEYLPETLHSYIQSFTMVKQRMPIFEVKLYMYQCFRALAYLHSMGICHRSVKPKNLLLDPTRGILKICDLGNSRILVDGGPNEMPYSTVYYRAPELIFGCDKYTNLIDIWSAGCVMAECLLGSVLMRGENAIDQLVEIIKVLGTPSREDIATMNLKFANHKFPIIKPFPFSKIFYPLPEEVVLEFLASLLRYNPQARPTAIEALAHNIFDVLRNPTSSFKSLVNGEMIDVPLPPLFNFTEQELSINPELNSKLVPFHVCEQIGHGRDLVQKYQATLSCPHSPCEANS